MQINRIGYQPQRTQPNFQAKIRIVDKWAERLILEDQNKYTGNDFEGIRRILDKFEEFEPDKIIAVKKAESSKYTFINEYNNKIFNSNDSFFTALEYLMSDEDSYLKHFWKDKPSIIKHSVFIQKETP